MKWIVAMVMALRLFLGRSEVKQELTKVPVPTVTPAAIVLMDVPFTSQAPLSEWKDPRQQDACEETALLMAMKWVRGEKIASKQAAKNEILAISKYQEETFGEYHDTSAADAAKRIIEGYYHYTNYEIKPVRSVDDLINELDNGNLIVAPFNGRALGNKNFTQPGPERHMLVIKGFDRKKLQFITNENGIWMGENWRYDQDILFNAIRDYPTGDHVPITQVSKVMIVIRK